MKILLCILISIFFKRNRLIFVKPSFQKNTLNLKFLFTLLVEIRRYPNINHNLVVNRTEFFNDEK